MYIQRYDGEDDETQPKHIHSRSYHNAKTPPSHCILHAARSRATTPSHLATGTHDFVHEQQLRCEDCR